MRLFAGLRDGAGWAERRLSFDAAKQLTPHALWRDLDLGPEAMPATVRVAINHAFAAADTPLAAGDEVAFLPPITGG